MLNQLARSLFIYSGTGSMMSAIVKANTVGDGDFDHFLCVVRANIPSRLRKHNPVDDMNHAIDGINVELDQRRLI